MKIEKENVSETWASQKPHSTRRPQDGHLRTMEIEFTKWCDNHAYSGLMQRITCELGNLSNKLKDTKANQNTTSKNSTTSLQLALHFSFSPVSFLPNLANFLYGQLVEISDVSAFLSQYYRSLGFWAVMKQTQALIIMDSKNQLIFSMVPIHSRWPWASCNLYTSYAFKTPMVFL